MKIDSCFLLRYKESITKSTRGWKERFFSRNNSIQDHGSEARNEVSSNLATVSRLMEHLETREASTTPVSPLSNRLEEDLPHLLPDHSVQQMSEINGNHSLSEGNSQTPCATSSSHWILIEWCIKVMTFSLKGNWSYWWFSRFYLLSLFCFETLPITTWSCVNKDIYIWNMVCCILSSYYIQTAYLWIVVWRLQCSNSFLRNHMSS